MKCIQTKDNVLRVSDQEAAKLVSNGSGRYTTRLAWKNANHAEHQANVKLNQQLDDAAQKRKDAAKKKLESGN